MPVTEHRPVLARWRTRALELVGAAQDAGPVFVLLHGFGDHAGTWSPLLAELERTGHRAVALDMPGFGVCAGTGRGPVLPALDEFVAAAVERWTVDGVPPIVVGNSLGGLQAIRAAQTGVPLTGIAPLSPAGFSHVWFLDVLEKYSWINPLLFTPVVPMPLFRHLTAVGYSWAASGPGRVLPGIPSAAAAHFRSGADVKRIFGTAPRILTEIRATPRTRVEAPCLILWGRHDRLTLVGGVQHVQALSPDAGVVVLEDCGHCAQVQRPDLVAAELVRFARSLVESAAG